jgi:hypothetical protein
MFCHCGCGDPAPLAPYTYRARGWVCGEPIRFIHGHNASQIVRVPLNGEQNANWKGGKRLLRTGYIAVRVTSGKQAKYRGEHVLVVERAIGHALPAGAIVHHVNDSKTHNVPSNLVALQSRQEHIELHRKRRVLRAGGDPWTDRMCCDCQAPKPATSFHRSNTRLGWRFDSRCAECLHAHSLSRRRAGAVA